MAVPIDLIAWMFVGDEADHFCLKKISILLNTSILTLPSWFHHPGLWGLGTFCGFMTMWLG